MREEDMPPLCSTSDTTAHLLTLLLDDILTLCSFLTSNPLHLAYIFLFSPYLLPLLSFLSPILLSTSLFLLFSILIASPQLSDPPLPSPELPGNAFRAVVGILKAKFDGEAAGSLVPVDDVQPYMVIAHALLGNGMFDWDFDSMCEVYKDPSPTCQLSKNPADHGLENSEKGELLESKTETGDHGIANEVEVNYKVAEDVLKASPQSQDILADNMGDNPMRSMSMGRREHMRTPSEGLQRDGSMRKEKEWKRTLACKLYEERITYKLCEERTVADKGEEMDLLWEAYEDDANKTGNKKDKGKKDEQRHEETEEEEDDDAVGRLCCLQAFRLSAGKMNLGMGRPNLVKVSKVLKGMGLFRSVGKRSGKKK